MTDQTSDPTPGSMQPRIFCFACGASIDARAEICPACGVRQPGRPGASGGADGPSKVAAGLLAILLGSFGAHRFYLGDVGLGVLYALFSWTGIPGLVGLIEGIIYLTKSDEAWAREHPPGTGGSRGVLIGCAIVAVILIGLTILAVLLLSVAESSVQNTLQEIGAGLE